MVTKMLMLSCLMRMLVTTNCLVLNPIPEPPYLTRPRRGSECVISTLSRPQERVQDSGIGNLLVAQRKVICTPVMYLCSQSTDSPIPPPQPEASGRAAPPTLNTRPYAVPSPRGERSRRPTATNTGLVGSSPTVGTSTGSSST